MKPHPGWFARTALVGLATLSGCILLYDEPAAGGAGAGFGGGASGGAGGAGAGGAGAGGTAGPGGGGSGGNPACSDCGPPGCDSNDVCVISTSASNPVQRVLFVRGQEQLPSSGYVVAHASPAAPEDEESLLAWPIEFEQDAPLTPFTLPDPGVGFVAAGGQDHFYYFGQGQTCDGDPEGGDSCVNVCSVSAAGVDCGNSRALTQGHHVNGAVAQVSADAPDEDVVFFVEADEGADEQLWNVNRACLEETETDCTATGAVSYNAPNELNPLGLDRHDRDGSLWWNTWAGAPGLACVYNYPGTGSVPLDCVPTDPPIARPNRLAVSGTSVFVGTYAGNAGLNPGPIQQLHRCMAQGKRPVTTLSGVQWPADADGQLLYATSSQSQAKLMVLNANTGETVASYAGAEPISWVDASNPKYVLFAAGSTIYRMLKPPKPCPEQPGAQVCGNGCIETGEDCDDGNSVDGDTCSGMCLCSLPT